MAGPITTPPPLNRQPNGLLDFFGIKNGGRYPQVLDERLQPVVDLLRHYTELAAQVFVWSGTIAATQDASSTNIPTTLPTNLSVSSQLEVPNNEVWYIAAAHIQWTMRANDSAQFNIADTDPFGAIPGYSRYWPMYLQGSAAAAAAPAVRRGISVLAQPVYVLPGRIIVAPHNGVVVTTGPVDYFGSISLVRMRL